MRILVTGGAGFIGSNFVRKSIGGDFPGISSVVVLDKFTYAGVLQNLAPVFDSSNFKLVRGDICNLELVTELIDSCDAVINFAAESHVDRSINNASEFITTNIGGVQTLLDGIRASGRNQRFLQVSTDEVYGSIPVGSWDENCLLQPNSPYSASKAAGELIARSYHQTHGVDIVTTRCSNNYGPYHYPEKLIPLFITNLIEGKKIPVYGNGLNVRDWLHVDDHCRGIFQVLMRGRSGEIYNIGGGRELTNLEITKLILDEMQADESSIEYVEDRKGHDIRYSVNWEKISEELDYEPQVSFELGLRETIRWYQDNVAWWTPLKYQTEI